MFLFLLQGCTPDKWTPTREVCGLAEPLDWGLLSTGDSGERHGLIPPSGCAEALLEDLGAKPQRLLDDIGASGTLDDHIEDVRTGVAPLDGLASVVWGMYWLVGGDFGTVGGLDESDYADPVWVEDFNRLADGQGVGGAAPLSQVLYNEIGRQVNGVEWFPEGYEDVGRFEMGMRPARGVLVVPRAEQIPGDVVDRPNQSTGTLLHESMHARSDTHDHTLCLPPAKATGEGCDADLTGAYGAEFAMTWAEVVAATGGGSCVPTDEAGSVAYEDVVYMGRMWATAVILPPPAAVPYCD